VSVGFEYFDQPLDGAKLVALIEVVRTQVCVYGSALQQVIASSENGVRHGDDGSHHSACCCKTTKLCSEISILGFRRRPSGLAESMTSPAVTLTALPALAFPGALMIAWKNFDQLARCAAVGKACTSGPLSATSVHAIRCLMPGMLHRRLSGSVSARRSDPASREQKDCKNARSHRPTTNQTVVRTRNSHRRLRPGRCRLCTSYLLHRRKV
jgi:hypothetical protein